jgi:hypothetical protein
MVIAAFALAVVGCSTPTEGQPTSEDEAPTTSSDEPSTSESTPAGSKTFTNTQLCEFLTTDEAQGLGASANGEPGYSLKDGSPYCQWSAATALTIGFQEGAQVGNGPSGAGITNTPVTVAGEEAVQSLLVEPNREFCQIMVDLSDNSLLAAGASVREGSQLPCDVAMQLAEIIIPKAMDR